MPTRSDPLTEAERAEIARRRAEAREKARRQLAASDPAEEARIEAAALADPDAPPMTDAELARLRPAHEVVPELVARTLRRRGRPAGSTKPDAKRLVSLRLSPDVLEHFKAGGPGWQGRIDEALKAAIKRRP